GYVKITVWEAGSFINLEKKVFDNKLKLTVSGRIDKNQNYDPVVSPAASLVYSPNNKHSIRFSFSSGLRNPTLQDQYLYLNVGRAILLGNRSGYDSLVTLQSLVNWVAQGGNPADFDRYIQVISVKRVVPEQVRSFEIGYKGEPVKHLFIDASFYYSFYTNFIGYRLLSSVPSRDPNDIRPIQIYRVTANSPDMVTTHGFSFGYSYFFKRYYGFTGNYSWNVLDRRGSTDPIIPAFNTPEHKFNIGISGRNVRVRIGSALIQNWGFAINYKWVQGFWFEGSPQFTGFVPGYSQVDMQINYSYPKWKTTFKLGASNLLNHQFIQAYGAPMIGRLAYFQINYDMNFQP
ncbi:MAG: TonB-dependent receptor, partial [Bacteroidia bacterium]|nr:TonB-dependent receptor [Bacteroidia bacterium]